MKKYILIAGVNGAGKSTLYHILEELYEMPRINTDEIISEIGRWDNINDVIKAGKIVIEKIQKYFEQGISFNQETTLCGKTIIKNIKRAKKENYFVEVHYVGVDSVEIAKERVHYRISKGGHGIPDKDIERRYMESFCKLVDILDECDLITFYDNTEYFERFAIYKNGRMEILLDKIPMWFGKLMKMKN